MAILPHGHCLFASSNPGLGDQIILNGAINYLTECFDSVCFTSIGGSSVYEQMCRQWEHNPKVHVHHCHCDTAGLKSSRANKALKQIHKNNCPHYQYRAIVLQRPRFQRMAQRYGLSPRHNTWIEMFYCHIVGGSMKEHMNYETRYTHFHAPRDKKREQKLLDILKLPDKFCFFVDKGSNPLFWFSGKPVTKYPIVTPDWWSGPDMMVLWESFHIWDWIAVLERATEIYTIDTAWFHLIKQLRLDTPRYFINNYPVVNSPFRARYLLKCVVNSNYLNDEWDNGWKVVYGPGIEIDGLGERGRIV